VHSPGYHNRQWFLSEQKAREAYDQAMRDEWDNNQPEDPETCEPLPYPGDPDAAHDALVDWDREGTWGRWEITTHEVEA
jgi:hypothetical protein